MLGQGRCQAFISQRQSNNNDIGMFRDHRLLKPQQSSADVCPQFREISHLMAIALL
jgi:hypothetical protein